MKKLLVGMIIFFNLYCNAQIPHPATDPNYYLLFSDEFDDTAIHTSSKWNIVNWIVNDGKYNETINTARSENVKIEDGLLKTAATMNPYLGYNYTLGALISKPYFLPGCYVETYSKIQNNKYTWPAFWLFAGFDDPPLHTCDYREIDILEYVAEKSKSTANIHFCKDGIRQGIVSYYNIGDTSIWHKYACLWDGKNITTVLDGKNVLVQSNIYTLNLPMYLLIDEAIAFKDSTEALPTSGYFPITYKTDYARVYRLHYECGVSDTVNEISNFSTFHYAVKKSIKLSGATTVPTSSTISLRASEFIELFSGFEVPNGTDFSLNINPCDAP